MAFKKGNQLRKGRNPWNKGLIWDEMLGNTNGFKKGEPSWNKGLEGYKAGEKHWNFGEHRSDETKLKISIKLKGRKVWNKGIQAFDKKHYEEIGLKGLIKQQNMKEPTSIEKKVYDYLILKGIIFERQKLINGKFLVDAYIPSLNLVIEADGDYWHTLDRVVKKDKAENAYLTKCGFSLLRLSETDINKTPIDILMSSIGLKGGE